MEDRERNNDAQAERPGEAGAGEESTGTVNDSQGSAQNSGSKYPSDSASELAGEVTTGDEP